MSNLYLTYWNLYVIVASQDQATFAHAFWCCPKLNIHFGNQYLKAFHSVKNAHRSLCHYCSCFTRSSFTIMLLLLLYYISSLLHILLCVYQHFLMGHCDYIHLYVPFCYCGSFGVWDLWGVRAVKYSLHIFYLTHTSFENVNKGTLIRERKKTCIYIFFF